MKKGFTVIELMVAITVIGFLSAIILPRFTESTKDAKVAQVQSNLANLRTSVGMFYAAEGEWPKYGDVDNDVDEISAEGDFSTLFGEFYQKGLTPETPASENINSSNKVVEKRDDTGGWLYYEENGEFYANLSDGNYTGDILKEIWDEENKDEDGTEPEKPPVEEEKKLSGEELKMFDTDPDDFLGIGYGPDGLRYEDEKLEVSPYRGGTLTFDDPVSEVTFTASYYVEEDGWNVTDNGDGTYAYSKSFDPASNQVNTPAPSLTDLIKGDNYISEIEYK